MLILGIDTSTKICTCSIFDSENGVIAETSLSVKKNHSNIVMPIIDNLFKISELNINDIDKIAVAIGPGSFTGVRIALGIAKGLAMALNKPLIAVNELDILEAIASGNENEIIPLIDARKERVYYKYQNTYIDDYLINLISNFDKNKKYDLQLPSKFKVFSASALKHRELIDAITSSKLAIGIWLGQ